MGLLKTTTVIYVDGAYMISILKRLFSFVLILAIACVDRLENDFVTSGPDENQIVVDGFISDQPGPYFVSVFRPSKVTDNLQIRDGIIVKKITIFDDQGNEEELESVGMGEDDRGLYSTKPDGIRGVVGRKYSVRIELLDGRIFTSVPDELQPVGKIDSIIVKFETHKPLSGPTEYSFRVFIDATTGANTFVRWKYTGVFFIRTLQSECWSSIFEQRPNVSDGQFVQGDQIKFVEVGNVPVDEVTFFQKFMVQVDQMSLNRTSFDFFKTIRDQFDAKQSLFQPAIGALPGNIFEESTKEQAMGLFYATAITTERIFLTRNDVPVLLPVLDIGTIDAPCVGVFRNAVASKPPGWID